MNENPNAMPRVVIFATSLNKGSRSQLLARHVRDLLFSREIEAELVDLREAALPVYGSDGDSRSAATVKRLQQLSGNATHVIFATPIYNFGVNAATKNLLEHLGYEGLQAKTVGIMSAAGGRASFMAPLPLANSLMLDFRCWIVPKFVQAVGADFEGDTIKSPELIKRIDEFMELFLGRAAVVAMH